MKRVIIILAIAAVGLGTAAFFLLNSPGSDTQAGSNSASRNPDGIFQEPGLGGDTGLNSKIRAAEVLSDYRKWALYPPWSRPMNAVDTDYINHRIIELPFRALYYRDANKKRHSTPYACRLQAKTHTVVEGETQKLVLACFRGTPEDGHSRNKMRELRITGHKLRMLKPAGAVGLPSYLVKYNDKGVDGDAHAGDRKYTFVYKPASGDWGDMQVLVKFRVPGSREGREFQLATQFFSSPRAPARFTGRFTDSLENGNLRIMVRVNVRKAGLFRIQGNLRTETGYIAAAKTEIKLKKGQRDVPLRFFGKIFHDKNAHGPYILSGLRGFRRNDMFDPDSLALSPDKAARYIEKVQKRIEKDPNSVEPDREVIPALAAEYKTRVYTPVDFSDRQWESRRKTEKIAALMEQVAAEKRGVQ